MQRHISMEQIDCLQFEVNNLKPVEVSSNTKNMYTYIIYIYTVFAHHNAGMETKSGVVQGDLAAKGGFAHADPLKWGFAFGCWGSVKTPDLRSW